MNRDLYLVVGDSFVRRLDRLMECDQRQYRSFKRNFGMSFARVELEGRIQGRKIAFIRHVEEWVDRHWRRVRRAQVFCIQIGSNDLLELFMDRGVALAQEVVNLAKRILDIGSLVL